MRRLAAATTASVALSLSLLTAPQPATAQPGGQRVTPAEDTTCLLAGTTTCFGRLHLNLTMTPEDGTVGEQVTAAVTLARWMFTCPAGTPEDAVGMASTATCTGHLEDTMPSGTIALQSKTPDGTAWGDRESKTLSSGPTLVYLGTTMKAGTTDWRAVVLHVNSTSPAGYDASNVVTLTAATPTTTVAMTSTKASKTKVSVGATVTLTAYADVKYTNGDWYPVGKGATAKVQFRGAGQSSWRNVATVRSDSSGRFRVKLHPWATGVWRMVHGTAASSPVRVTVTANRPVRVEVTWPSRVWLSFAVSAWVAGSNGNAWPERVRLELQYRPNRLTGWRTLDYGYAQGSRGTTLACSFAAAGYYRVVAPSLGLSSNATYG